MASSSNPESSKSTAYRNPTVADEDDDDLDDLDDVLASFNAKPSTSNPSKLPKPTSPPTQPSTSTTKPQNPISPTNEDNDDEDFEASLVEGMESLLKSLAGDHPPGPMADTSTTSGKSPTNPVNGVGGLSPEEEEKAWQKAVEMMLSGEGIEALGLNGTTGTSPPPPLPSGSSGPSGPSGQQSKPATFDETIKKTLESLQKPGEKVLNGENGGAPPDLAALLAQLGADPSVLGDLGGLGGEGDDDELGGLLDGMMRQLMTREVLEEPMGELASKYPAYLASPPATTSPADLEKYKSQYTLVTSILTLFKNPGFTDEKDGKEIARLVGEMQDLGGPPQEIMGELPEGFDLGALGGGGEEGCLIM